MSRSITRARVIALPAAAALLLSCLPGERLVRVTRAVERPDIEITAGGSALVRSVFCDIMVEPADSALWAKLAATSACTNRPARGARSRVPPLAAFHVIIRSTIGAPLRLESARLVSGDISRDRLAIDAAARRLASPAYSIWNVAGLLSFRRLTVEKDSARWIDYDGETIASTLGFIPPYDSAVTMLMFERLPVECGKFRLTLELSASGNRRSVSYDFVARDYRAGGREYRKIREETMRTGDE